MILVYREGKTRTRSEKNNGRQDRRQERRQVPLRPSAHQPRLVAEPTEHSGPSRELVPVRSDGQAVRLRQGVQEPRLERRDQGPGGRPTSDTTVDCSSAWRGTARARTASPTAA